MRCLGLLCEYFIATDDATAASIAEWPSGPSQPPESRGWRRGVGDPLPTVHAGGIEPVVLLAILEGLLTGRDDGDLVLAEPTVLGVRAVASAATAAVVWGASIHGADFKTATGDQTSTVSVRWAEAEEFDGMADPAELTRGLTQLAGLAREARRANARVYCWMSL